MLNSICVYCGSSFGSDASFTREAKTLGTRLADENIRLVYGGGNVGLMGALADAALEAGGEVLGVIPHSLKQKEVHHPGVSELVVVESMHERKALMVEQSDGFIALPGGFGTLDELFETLTWAQLGFHQKPIGLLNVDGYYNHLLSFIRGATDKQLVKPAHEEMLVVDDQVDPLLERLKQFVPVNVTKWQ